MKLDAVKYRIEDNVLKGVPFPLPKVEYTSLGEMALDNLTSDPDFVGQIDAVTGEKWKYEKMRDRSVRCALWMKAQGLLSEDVVMICSHNQMDVAMAAFGALYLGAIFNPLDVGLHLNDFRHMFEITKPKIVFANEDTAETISKVAEDMNIDVKIVVFGRVQGFLNFESILAEAGIHEVQNFKCTPIENPNKTAVILSTSGTTGAPKGVALAHSVYLQQMLPIHYVISQHQVLIFTSLAWYTGTLLMITTMCKKAPRLVPPPFEENSACELIEKYKVTFVFMAPNMINRMLKGDAIQKHDLSSLKDVVCGGSSLAIASQHAFVKMVPNAVLSMGYGMTEVGSPVSVQKPGAKEGSCGCITETAQVKVIDPETGKTLKPGQTGELLLKTNAMMNGYYNDPEATAQAIDEEGWMHSGDLGYFDEDGEIFVIDRLKEMIKYRGYHISPVEIENVLVTHPGVKEVVVIGLPHPIDDERPIAFVVKTDLTIYKKEVTEQELIDYVAAQVADSKRLRGGVRFVNFLPKTPSSKIQRREVRALAKSLMVS